MELYLNREKINHVRNILNTSITQEETMEMIVPDSSPDILRIISVDTTVLVRGKEADAGRVSVSGVALATVIYAPEGTDGVRKINAEIPFTISAAESEITHLSKVIARVSPVSSDASIVNPRKFVLRADIRAELSCYNDDELSVTSDVELPGDSGIELLREGCDICLPVDVREKSFVISDEMTLPNSSPEIGELLRTRVTVTTEEAKVVGNKVIFRGHTNIAMLYSPAGGGELHNADLQSEFSQIMELENISEECQFDMVLILTGVYIDPGNADYSDGRSVSCELHVVAQCVAVERKTISFISDIYSTKYDIMKSPQELEFEHKEPAAKFSSMFRDTLETPGDVERVIAVSAETGTAETEDGTLKAPIYVKCIYLGGDGRVLSISSRFMAESPWAGAAGDNSSTHAISASVGSEVYGAAAGGGIELRIPVDFTVSETVIIRVSHLDEISYDEESAIDTSKMPSLMISKAFRGDTLWKLAKKHHSTAELILSANDLASEEDIIEGQMLIVPKKR